MNKKKRTLNKIILNLANFNLKSPFLQIFLFTIILSVYTIPYVESIGCYKCSTTNNESTCTDPFNPGVSNISLYEAECKSGIQGRIGLFPARYCLKVSGFKASTGEQIVIRTCTVSKLLDSDSSHSSFTLKLEDGTEIQVVSGLIASCKDDGCNSSNRNKILSHLLSFMSLIPLLFNTFF